MVAMLQEILKHYRLQYIYIVHIFIHSSDDSNNYYSAGNKTRLHGPTIVASAQVSLQAVDPIKEHELTSSSAVVVDG